MIEEDSDEAEDYNISQSSPEEKHISDESCVISDFSSPCKAEGEAITEVSSPERDEGSFEHSINQNLKRKRRTHNNRSFKLRKKPTLNLKITKKKTSIGLNEEACCHVNSDIIHSEENSPEASKLDSSCDIFAGQENITDVSSPELDFHLDHNEKEKEEIDTKRRFNSTKSLPLNAVVIASPPVSFEEIIDDVSSSCLLKEENLRGIPESYQSNTNTSSDILVLEEKNSKESRDLLFYIEPGNKLKQNDRTALDTSAYAITKAPKKGSLLEKALQVDSLMKNESVLYSHELNVGLRTSCGTFVSDLLIVKAIHSDETYNLLECVPQMLFSEFNKTGMKECFYIKTSKLVQGVKENCSIVVHFPVLTMYDTFLQCHIIFANDRVQVTSKKLILQSSFFRKLKMCVSKHSKLFRYLKSRASKNILDALLGNCLFHDFTLQLEILHLYRNRSKKNEAEFIELLAIDSENQFCIAHLDLNDEVVRSQKLQMGCIYTFVGFSLVQCKDIDSKMKYVIEYYSSHCIKNEYIFVIERVNPNWNISFLKKSISDRRCCITNLDDIKHQEFADGRRFKLAINAVNCDNNEVYIKEQSTNKFIRLRVETGITGISFPVKPFLLDGLYLLRDEVTYDVFSRIEVLKK